MQSVLENNPFKERYKANNDAYVHVRLGDVASKSPGLQYYIKVLDMINFDNLYIYTNEMYINQYNLDNTCQI